MISANPFKSDDVAAQERVFQLERELAEKDKLIYKLQHPELKKSKRPRKPVNWRRFGILIRKVGGWTCFLAGSFYALIWTFEWQKIHTYEGEIISALKKNKISTETTSINNGKPKISHTETQNYELFIRFIDEDGDNRKVKFFTTEESNWNKDGNYPFPQPFALSYYPPNTNSTHKMLFVGGASPYIGCKVKVHELRGAILNSTSARDFVADASMCNKQANKPPAEAPAK